MLRIDSSEALARSLALPLDPRMAALLMERQRQLGGEVKDHCCFVLFQPGDRPCWLEETLGFSIFESAAGNSCFGDPGWTPAFEYIDHHVGVCFELVFQFTEDFAHVVLVADAPGVNRDVLHLCTASTAQHA